jgi:acyl carrier protein
MGSIAEQIRNYITHDLLFSDDTYPLPDEASFLEAGVIDSMNVMALVMHVEEAFGVPVEDEDIVPANFDSISNIVNFIERKRVMA